MSQTAVLRCLALIVCLAGTRSAFAQRDLKDIPPPDPELERKSFVLPDGFEVNLFATDPQIAKPIQMNFDPQGRLWIASSEVYPHILPGQKANDRILILEDSDGDGMCDKTTVFADGLLIPTGVLPGDGGAYVANSTELIHLRDTDGDGRADEKRVVLSGFGTEDTHHLLHTLRWGPGGLMYMNQSIYIHSHIETPYGVKRLNGGGIWEFRPETMELDILMRGLVNPWGHRIDPWGQSFATDGAGNQGINYVLPGASYQTAVGASRILPGLNPGSPKHCGLEIVSGRHLPDDWQGNLITNDFRAHRVCRFVLSDDGAGFAAREQEELIKSAHVAFRPIDVAQGPDGAIYIADWYNPIIQHGEVDFRDPRRDHVHGRIWRVTYKKRPLVKRPQLADAPVSELLDALTAAEGWTRRSARRVLTERGAKAILPDLQRWAGAQSGRAQLEALWMYQAFRTVEPRLLDSVLNADDPRVRAGAVRVLGHWHERLDDPVALLEPRIVDVHPRVRLEAARVLGKIPESRAFQTLMRVFEREFDPFLDYAVWLTVRELRPVWFDAVRDGRLTFRDHPQRLLFLVRATGATELVPQVVAQVLEGDPAPQLRDEALDVVTSYGGRQELRLAFDVALKESTGHERAAGILAALADAAATRKIVPAGDLTAAETLLSSDNVPLAAAAARCCGLWKIRTAQPKLSELSVNEQVQTPLRAAALDALALVAPAACRKTCEKLAARENAEDVRARAVAVAVRLDAKAAGVLAVPVLKDAKQPATAEALVRAFLADRKGPAELAGALAGQRVPGDTAKIALRVVRSTGRKLPELEAGLIAAGGIKTGPVTLSPREMAAFVADVRERGNAARGEAIFRRQTLGCFKCHAIGGAGGLVGPDLASIGGSAQVDYLIESLLDPSKKVKENYHTIVVSTLGGKVISGVKVRQTGNALIVRDAEDQEIAVPLNDIDEQAEGASLMPAGLTEKLTHPEIVDLVRFLSELGKVGPYAVSKQRIARRWQLLQPDKDSFYRLRRTRFATVTQDDPAYKWSSAYSTVGGILPLEDLRRMQFASQVWKTRHKNVTAFARCEIDSTTAGLVELRLNSPAGVQLWVGAQPVDVQERVQLKLPSGRTRLTFAVNLEERKQGLRLELADVPGSQAQAQFVGGK